MRGINGMSIRAGDSGALFHPDTPEMGADRNGNNPFQELGRQNHDRHASSKLSKRSIQSAVLGAFDRWDKMVVQRLQQLCDAVMPELRKKPVLDFMRLFCRNYFIWRFWGSKVKYRIIRDRKAGCWAVELYRSQAYYSYNNQYLVKLSFSLDEQFSPAGFHLCRGSDNKTFDTNALREDLLTRTLLCHFSRLKCGDNVDADVLHLTYLREQNMISSEVFALEKQHLHCNRSQSRLYVLPARSARSSLKMEARLRLLFCIFCSLLIVAALLYAKKFGGAAAPVSKPGAELLNRK